MNIDNKNNISEYIPCNNEQFFFSIYCGIDFLHWSLHKGLTGEALPLLFWRTPHLSEAEFRDLDPCEYLSSNLTKSAHNYIFGEWNVPSITNAKVALASRKANYISVYVLIVNHESSNQKHLLLQLWNVVPCRHILIEKQVKSCSSPYRDCGINTLVMLRGAAALKDYPVFVICADKNVSFAGSIQNRTTAISGDIGPFSIDEHHVTKIIEIIGVWTRMAEKGNLVQRKTNYIVVTGDKRVTLLEKIQNLNMTMENFDITEKKYLIHYGISDIIMEMARLHKNDVSDDFKTPNFEIYIEKKSDKNTLHDNLVGKIILCGNEFKNSTNDDEDIVDKSLPRTENVSTQMEACQHFTPPEKKRQLFQSIEREKTSILKSSLKESEITNDSITSRKLRNMSPSRKRVERNALSSQGQTKSCKVFVNDNPRTYIKTRVAKRFGRTLYFGTITHYRREGLWHVLYDDGDEEDYDRKDLSKAEKLYDKNKNKDTFF